MCALSLTAKSVSSAYTALTMTTTTARQPCLLWLAAQEGCIAKVTHLLSTAEPDTFDIRKALLISACNDHVDVMVALLERARAHTVCADGFELLHTAARCGSTRTVHALMLARPADDPDHVLNWNYVVTAAKHGHVDTVKVLVANGADVNGTNAPLRAAAEEGHVDVASFLLDAKAAVDKPPKYEYWPPLLAAARNARWSMVEFLVQRGAAVDIKSENTGSTALFFAAQYGHRATAALLLRSKTAVDGVDCRSVPLAAAVQVGNVAVTSLLLRHGANVDKEGRPSGKTPLFYAAAIERRYTQPARAMQLARIEAARLLLDRGASIHHVDACGKTALSYVCALGYTEIAEMLLDRKAAVDHADHDQMTPLIHAASGDHECTARLLVRHGANIEWARAEGGPPLAHAVANDNESVAQFLVNCKASTECRGFGGSTLLDLALTTSSSMASLILSWDRDDAW